MTGIVDAAPNDRYATLVWNDDEYISINSINLYDATDEQKQLFKQLADDNQMITLENCRITAPQKRGAEFSRLQLKLDEDVMVQA